MSKCKECGRELPQSGVKTPQKDKGGDGARKEALNKRMVEIPAGSKEKKEKKDAQLDK